MLDGWRTILEAADMPAARFAEAMQNPAAAQVALLQQIIGRNRQSRFGLAYGFLSINDVATFRARLPISTYDDYRPAIQSIARGDTALLTAAPVTAFEATGGTSGGAKLVPYTEDHLAGFRAAILPWLADLARRRHGVTRGRVYAAISPVIRAPHVTPSGIAVGHGADAAYLGSELSPAFASLLAVDPKVARLTTLDDWRRATLVQLIEAVDLAFVSVWSPTFFLRLVEAIRTDAAVIAQQLSAAALNRMQAALSKQPIATEYLWPRLACISCWTDASSAIYARQLSALFPHVPIEGKGLLATEAAMTVPLDGKDGAVPALLSSFLEFVGEDGELHLCDDLAVGATYRVLVTVDGFYRYDIGDRVQCLAHEGRTPRLMFVGRAGIVSDLVGEKIDEGFAASVIKELGIAATLVAQQGAPAKGLAPHYELWLDRPVDDEHHLALRAEQLLSNNPQYAYAQTIGQLGPLLVSLRTDHLEARARRLAMAGRRLGDIKPVSLIIENGIPADDAHRVDFT